MLARRFACPPVNEAAYAPGGIPNADPKELTGTVLMPAPRETFLSLLGEMVQMVNEAVRRRASTAKDASKPLSLEYMADRFDVDDRQRLPPSRPEGWLRALSPRRPSRRGTMASLGLAQPGDGPTAQTR